MHFLVSGILLLCAPWDLVNYLEKHNEVEHRNNLYLSYSLIGLTVVLFPIFTFAIMFMNHEKLRKGFFKKRFGRFYDEIDISYALNKSYPFLFISRRIIIVAVSIFMSEA